MATFHLQIVSMDRLVFDGQVQSVSCRTIHGDLAILARHCNYCTAIGMGTAHIVTEDGGKRSAACIGGMLSVMNGVCRLIPTTWEWKEEIDVDRARTSKQKAEGIMKQTGLSEKDLKLAEARLHRALVRIGTAGE
ncbi:ATP synthase F1 subunit epsilon [Clostridiaceae bacterium]|nr:ATP synthase F1 subunit epsilon [Clostridiaceae bacterium]